MKNHISSLFRLAIVTLTALPALALAVPSTSPYNTDIANSYVQDQTVLIRLSHTATRCSKT